MCYTEVTFAQTSWTKSKEIFLSLYKLFTKFLWIFHSLQSGETTLTAQMTWTIIVKLYILPFKITAQYPYMQRLRTCLLHSLDKTTVYASYIKHSTSKVQSNLARTYNPSRALNLVHLALLKDLTIVWTTHTALLYSIISTLFSLYHTHLLHITYTALQIITTSDNMYDINKLRLNQVPWSQKWVTCWKTVLLLASIFIWHNDII